MRTFTRSLIILTLCITGQLLSSTAFADEQDRQAPLNAQQRTQIQGVGNALLKANRTYQPDEDASAIRAQVDQVRQAIETLTKPLDSTPLTVSVNNATATASALTAQTASVSSAEQWQQARASQINQLNNELAKLRQHCDDYRNKQQAKKPGLFKRFTALLSGNNKPAKKHPVITEASERVLTRLENLGVEVDETLALPADQRQQKLLALSDSLRFQKQLVITPDAEPNDTPTYLTRTKHR